MRQVPNKVTSRDLMRLVHGELSESREEELRALIASDPDLGNRLQRMKATWSALEPPPQSPAPLGFSEKIVAQAVEETQESLRLEAPGWVRLVGAAALAAGLTAGILLGRADRSIPGNPHLGAQFGSRPSLAEAYWAALEDDSDDFGGIEGEGTVR